MSPRYALISFGGLQKAPPSIVEGSRLVFYFTILAEHFLARRAQVPELASLGQDITFEGTDSIVVGRNCPADGITKPGEVRMHCAEPLVELETGLPDLVGVLR